MRPADIDMYRRSLGPEDSSVADQEPAGLHAGVSAERVPGVDCGANRIAVDRFLLELVGDRMFLQWPSDPSEPRRVRVFEVPRVPAFYDALVVVRVGAVIGGLRFPEDAACARYLVALRWPCRASDWPTALAAE